MLSGGETPFQHVESEDFFAFLKDDGKPELPEETPNELVGLLNEMCYKRESSKRATFTELSNALKKFL